MFRGEARALFLLFLGLAALLCFPLCVRMPLWAQLPTAHMYKLVAHGGRGFYDGVRICMKVQ